MKGDSLLREVLSEFSNYGIKPRLQERSKHRMLLWEVNGMRQAYTISRSPGDHRASIETIMGIRRLLRRAGVR